MARRFQTSRRRIAPVHASRQSRRSPHLHDPVDDLAKAVGLKSHKAGATDPAERARLRAELDGLVAHLYGLSEEEYTHILGTFPLVADAVKVDAHNAYRRVAKGLVD